MCGGGGGGGGGGDDGLGQHVLCSSATYYAFDISADTKLRVIKPQELRDAGHCKAMDQDMAPVVRA